MSFYISSPLCQFDAEPVAEVVDVLGVMLHHCHVITRHLHIQSPVICIRLCHDLFHLVSVCLLPLLLWLKTKNTRHFTAATYKVTKTSNFIHLVQMRHTVGQNCQFLL